MLRDISSYLKAQGYSAYESTSVDLMTVINGETKIFEIKSTTPINIIAQAAKGAFQIACYFNAMVDEYDRLNGYLVLHKTGDVSLEKFVHDALERLEVKYLTYDPAREWPERVVGLLG
jgi:hypothetical protein